MSRISYLDSQAKFNSSGQYRWSLQRRISRSSRKIIFIGLNPSNADVSRDDATLRRITGFCRCWGYGILVVANLFARVSTTPQFLKRCNEPIGQCNDKELLGFFLKWSKSPLWDIWLGWGANGSLFNRNVEVMSLMKSFWDKRTSEFPKASGPLTLGVTLNGHPCHPLYLPTSSVLKPFSWSY